MKKANKPMTHPTLTTKYDISVGDKFYLNSYTVRNGIDLPDYNRIVWIKGEFFGVIYENCGIGNLERTMSISVLDDSNLNPACSNPSWIFVGK